MQTNTVLTSEGRSAIVLRPEGANPVIVTETHPNFARIAKALANNQDPLEMLNADVKAVVVNLSSRVSVVDDVLHFDGDPVYNGLASTIERYHAEGRDDVTGLVRFMERLSSNPSDSSREQLFTWTEATSLTIDSDGFIIGYKGVSARDSDQDYLDDEGQPLFPLDRYPFQSSGSGHGIVDGIEINGHLPMGVGVVVEMPRGEVNDNPREGCSTGLHVGNFNYAKDYSHSGALLEVRFDPADVVSVPSDCSFQKLRCCRYTGVAIHDEALGDDLSHHEPDGILEDDEAWDAFAMSAPQGWRERILARIRRKDRVSS